MKTAKGCLCLEQTDLDSYLGKTSKRQKAYLRTKYEIPCFKFSGTYLYPLRLLNKWILGKQAHLHNIDQPIKFCTPHEAAAILKKSWWTLARYRCEGKGPPFYYVGNLVRYVESDLIKWAFEQGSDPSTDGGKS